MQKHYPFLEGLAWALTHFKAPDLLKWSALMTASNIFFAVVERFSGASIVDSAIQLLAAPRALDFSQFSQGWAIAMLAALVSLYISARAMISAMSISRIKTAGPPEFLGWLWLQIYKTGINALCWYDRKLLAPTVVFGVVAMAAYALSQLAGGAYWNGAGAGFALTAGGWLFGISLLALFFAVLSWEIAFLVHYTRTSFSVYMFLEGNREVRHVVKKSHDMVVGRTLEVFLAQIFAMLVLLIPIIAGYLIAVAGIGMVAGGDFASGAFLFLVAMAFAVFVIALQQALSANIYGFFGKGKTSKVAKKIRAKKSGHKKTKKKRKKARHRRKA